MDQSDSDDSKNANVNEEIVEERFEKKNGEEVIKRYHKGKFLGKGGFAKCYEFKCLNNKKEYAAKIVSKDNLVKASAKQKLKSEIKIHKSLFHSNIVKFEHVFEDTQNVYILLELCKNKTLNELIKKRKTLTEIEVRFYLDQILKAVKLMHKNKIIHRDLKLGNLFLSESLDIKIGDFGLATQIQYEGEKKQTVCGTPNYIAPEILENKSIGHSYEVDYWAIGVIIYTLLIGRPPFETDDVKETYKRIQNNVYSFPNHVYVSEDAKDFISNILLTNPSHRLNLEQMRNHPFLNKTPLPKSLPQYSVNFPPKTQFLRKCKQENKIIEGIQDISNTSKEKEEIMNLRNFAVKNVKKLNMDGNFNNLNNTGVNQKEKKFLGNLNLNENSLGLKKGMELKINESYAKENNPEICVKRKMLELNNISYVVNIVDYSDKYGILYIMNNDTIGINFKDKSLIFKKLSSNEFEYYMKSNKKKLKLNINNTKDTPPEIKAKSEFLQKYESYLEKTKNDLLKPTDKIKSDVFVKKILKTEKAYILKMSNKSIQLTFHDTSIIVIDNYVTKSVIYLDKSKSLSSFDIHLVNKSSNKGFLKRYDYYKKIFYDKMEEYLSKNASNGKDDNNILNEII